MAQTPLTTTLPVPREHWEELSKKDTGMLCNFSLAEPHHPQGVTLRFLGELLLVNTSERCLERLEPGPRKRVEKPLKELIVLVYLLKATPEHLSHEMIGVGELKDAHFFQGPHELRTRDLLMRYGNDLEGFKRAAAALGGKPLDMADAAFRFSAFPKVPLYYLLWAGDEEFKPHLSVLFDRSIESHLSADAIWGLVNLVSEELLRAKWNNPSRNSATP